MKIYVCGGTPLQRTISLFLMFSALHFSPHPISLLLTVTPRTNCSLVSEFTAFLKFFFLVVAFLSVCFTIFIHPHGSLASSGIDLHKPFLPRFTTSSF